ncbi:GtrA family protein [Thermoactinomyces sp. DSM 45892]|uniref:GtrA family protein n=1 Tax=Thermoactinomyces sp. DSM 45892 TaxID=1882753 RepID=UPI000894E035|nr:GtrA family protein [Thermoactinomyces sp. DSM 45892]SDY13790.1 Putative flippase GtrA (transmembrane translocase of bactoprenol-linked glucose) [Thermoactinomyces sp. DSM 45892]
MDKRQVIRFIIVGVVNTVHFNLLYLIMYRFFSWGYYVSFLLAFVISMVGSFFMNSFYTYRVKPTWKKFIQFPMTNAVNFVVTTIGVYVLGDLLDWNKTISPFIASLIAIPFTFIISKKILVTEPDKGGRL